MSAVIAKYPSWSISDRQYKLTAQMFNGILGFSVYPRDRNAGRDAIIRINFDKDGAGMTGFLDVIDQIAKAPLGQKIPFSRTQFDMATKTRKTMWVITLSKDNDMNYSITLTDCATQKTVTMPITASQSFTIGNEPPSKATLSAMGMRIFKRWLTRADSDVAFTVDPERQFGGGNGNGGGNRPQNGGGYSQQPRTPSAPAISPTMEPDESMPF